MHTNSIGGPGLAHGRRRRLAEGDVDALLEAIRAQCGGVTLHALTRRAVGQMRPAAPAIDEEVEMPRQGKTARRGAQAADTQRS